MEYLYPENLTAKATLWLWNMRDFIIMCIIGLASIIALMQFGWTLPLAIALCFAFLTIRKDDTSVLDFIKYAWRYFVSSQQYFEWG